MKRTNDMPYSMLQYHIFFFSASALNLLMKQTGFGVDHI